MFLLNSRLGLFTAAFFGLNRKDYYLIKAPLIPKLRGHFAEFLQQSSLKRLSLLNLSTCVGLKYGFIYLKLFPDKTNKQ